MPETFTRKQCQTLVAERYDINVLSIFLDTINLDNKKLSSSFFQFYRFSWWNCRLNLPSKKIEFPSTMTIAVQKSWLNCRGAECSRWRINKRIKAVLGRCLHISIIGRNHQNHCQVNKARSLAPGHGGPLQNMTIHEHIRTRSSSPAEANYATVLNFKSGKL